MNHANFGLHHTPPARAELPVELVRFHARQLYRNKLEYEPITLDEWLTAELEVRQQMQQGSEGLDAGDRWPT